MNINSMKISSYFRYECGLARKFQDEKTKKLYIERTISCNWNRSWTPVDTLDKCVWTHCLYPPQVSLTIV